MLCDNCTKKKATVHLTEIIDEQMSEMHLCESCAKEKSVQMEQQFGLADLLAGLSDFGKQVKDVDKADLKCAHCGLTYDDFRKLGRLGCSQCYDSFKSHLSALLKKIHGSNKHSGKSPIDFKEPKKTSKTSKAAQAAVDTVDAEDDLADLKQQLLVAIGVEDFELAAELRDKIHAIEKKDGE